MALIWILIENHGFPLECQTGNKLTKRPRLGQFTIPEISSPLIMYMMNDERVGF